MNVQIGDLVTWKPYSETLGFMVGMVIEAREKPNGYITYIKVEVLRCDLPLYIGKEEYISLENLKPIGSDALLD